MLLKNVQVDNHEEVVDVRILNGKFSEIKANLAPRDGEEVIAVSYTHLRAHETSV